MLASDGHDKRRVAIADRSDACAPRLPRPSACCRKDAEAARREHGEPGQLKLTEALSTLLGGRELAPVVIRRELWRSALPRSRHVGRLVTQPAPAERRSSGPALSPTRRRHGDGAAFIPAVPLRGRRSSAAAAFGSCELDEEEHSRRFPWERARAQRSFARGAGLSHGSVRDRVSLLRATLTAWARDDVSPLTAEGDRMSAPFIFIATNRLKPGAGRKPGGACRSRSTPNTWAG